ncbi:MAG: POTRA domain-containing protein [Pseudomonadota bacterium]
MRTIRPRTKVWMVAAAVALAAWLVPAPRAAADPCTPCYGLPMGSARFEGVDQEAGFFDNVQVRLLSLTDLGRPGAVFSPEARRRAKERLTKSGFFLETFFACEVRDGAAHVVITAIPNSWVEKVEITGTEYFYASELEKRLFIRPGQVLNPAVEEDRARLERQVEVLLSYMRKQGFDKASVAPVLTPRPPKHLRILFKVEEGDVSRISRVRVEFAQPEVVAGEPEHSCPRLTRRVLQRVASIRSGTPYTRALARKTRKELQEWLQMYGFIAPRVSVNYDPERETLTADVKVEQCFSVVFLERLFDEPNEGSPSFRKVNDQDLYRALPFRESGAFDRTEAELGIDEVRAHYQTRGNLFARVDMQFADYRSGREDWPHPMVGAVRYMITLGEPAEIRKITIEGATQIREKELLGVMETVPYDFFGEGGYLQIEQLMGDMGRIRDHYRDQGFPRMTYPDAAGDPDLRVAVRREGASTIYQYTMGGRAFEVVKHQWESPIYIRIRVDEGSPSKVGALAVEGVEALDLPRLQKHWALMGGGLYSGFRVKNAVSDLKKRYLAEGYHKVLIEVSCVGRNPAVEAKECDPDKAMSREVDVTIRVRENDRSVMGEILWHGLRRSNSSVIQRDFPKAGQAFDKDKIDEAVRRIRNLGTFASVRTEFIGLDEDPPRDQVAVVIYVEEAVNKALELSAGFQTMPPRENAGQQRMNSFVNSLISASVQTTGSVLTGGARARAGDGEGPMIRLPDLLIMTELSYTDRNFVGRAKELTIPVKYGFSTTSLMRYVSFLPTYRDRRLFGTDLILRLTPLVEFDHALRDLDIFEYGLDTELSYLIMKRIFLSLGSKASRIAWKNPGENRLGAPETQFEVSPTVRFDWRNSPTNPSRGTYFGTRVTYINALNEKGARDNFVKLDVSAQAYLSFRRVVTLAVMGRMGTSWSVAGDRLPENHRFRLGGTSGVRGFPAGGVAQYQPSRLPRTRAVADDQGVITHEMIRDGDSVVNGTVEVRFPILRRQDFYGTLFLDFGGLSESVGDLHGNSLRFSVGTGIRYLVGGQFPLRLDYGFVLDRRCASVNPETGDFSGCEKESIGALDFGLLYTF